MLISREIIPTYVISIPHRHRRTDRKLCRITLLVSGYFAATPTRRKKIRPTRKPTHMQKNKETNYHRYYRYHRYFKSKIPVYGPSLLTSHTASILETT